MKLSTAVLTAGLAACTNARFLDTQAFLGSNAPAVDPTVDLKVPGENPLNFCTAPDSWILTIENVDLDPNPPQAGKDLLITARGNFSETVEEGAYVNLDVKYGLIKLVHTRADLCEQMKEIDQECPLEKGETLIQKTVTLPKQIPAGKFTVLADVYTKDGVKITCLNAQVTFPR